MPSTGLNGPHALDSSVIDRLIRAATPGAYALGRSDSQTFYVHYVGRSDTDLCARLKKWAEDGSYEHFKYGCYSSVKEAYEKECRLYHDWGADRGKLDNDVHPAKPQGKTWTCPSCGA